MTFEQWVLRTNNDFHTSDHHQRVGQFFFNRLCDVKPMLGERVRSEQFDPFYLNERLPVFLEFVSKHWDD